jgi:hypothetical protein
MWFNKDAGGICLFVFAYIMLIIIDFNVCFTALFELWHSNLVLALIISGVYQIFVILILISHFSCMTEDPGSIPLNYKELDESKLTEKTKKLLRIARNDDEEAKGSTSNDETKEDEQR